MLGNINLLPNDNNTNNKKMQTLEEAARLAKKAWKKENLYIVEFGNDFRVLTLEYVKQAKKPTKLSVINGKVYEERLYYCEGELLPSVTEIIKKTRSKAEKDRLRKWMMKVQKTSESDPREDARERGIRIHEEIKNYIETKDEPTSIFSKPIKQFISRVENFIEVEKFCFSKEHGFAGQLDAVGEIDKQLSLVDWKTTLKPKRRSWIKEHFLQAMAYKIAIEEREGCGIKQLAIVVLLPDTYQLFIVDDPSDLLDLEREWLGRIKNFRKLPKKIWREDDDN